MADSDTISDLLISLVHLRGSQYQVELRYTQPDELTEQSPRRGLTTFNDKDLQELRRYILNPQEYGRVLRREFLEKSGLDAYMRECLANAGDQLRLRIEVDPGASELMELRWETLYDLGDEDFMAASANRPLSRFLHSEDWNIYELEPLEEQRALIVVANPKELSQPEGFTIRDGLTDFQRSLASVNVDGEVNRALQALQKLSTKVVLADHPDSQGKATYDQILYHLMKGCDILYLVCHGALLKQALDQPQKPFLLIEKEDGSLHLLEGERLVRDINNLPADLRPRLVVLGSCQSGGQGQVPASEKDPGEVNEPERSYDRGALAALGPRLVVLGLPAVIAMQANVYMKTLDVFMPAFFDALLARSNSEGRVDRAMAMARLRAKEAQCPDWWVPVLYTRLKEGKLFPKQPPDPLKTYLQFASQKPKFLGKENLDLESQLGSVPFRARIVGQMDKRSINLYELVDSVFSKDGSGHYQRAVLLGSSGQGKTTALKTLVATYAEQTLTHSNNGRGAPGTPPPVIPVYLSLNDLRQYASFDSQVLKAINQLRERNQAQPIQNDQYEDWIEKNRFLYLFDDLEALITWRHGVGLEALTSFMSEPLHQDQRFLIACRSSSYQNQLGAIHLIELIDLEPEDVKRVLGKRFELLNKPMQKLAENRSLLKIILAFQNQNFRSKGQLIKRWVEYQLGLNADKVEGMDTFLVRTLLEELAYDMRSNHRLESDENRTIEIISNLLEARHERYHWRKAVDSLRKIGALRMDPIRRCFSFTERDYADYFSAAAVISQPARRKLILDTVSDYWWRDMLEVLVGLVEDPSSLLYELIDRDAFVAALCIQYAEIEPGSPVYSALIDSLIEQMDRESSVHRKEIIERIIESDHPRVPEVLLRRLHQEWSSIVLLAIARGLEKWKKSDDATQALVSMEENILSSFSREFESCKAWLRIKTPVCKEAADGEEELKYPNELVKLEKMAGNTRLPAKLRGLAAISLGLSHCRKAGSRLLELVQSPHVDDLVAWCALEVLIESPDRNLRREAYELYLKFDVVEFKDKHRFRARFIYLLGWMGGEAGNDLESPCLMVLKKALKDRHALVRAFAVQSLVRMNLKEARDTIEDMIGKETEPPVLRNIAEALGQIGTPDSIKVVESKLKLDVAQSNQSVRSAYRKAIQEIQERYGL